jgi:hypothetical protein
MMPNSLAAFSAFEMAAKQDPSLRWYAIADSAQNHALPGALTCNSQDVRCLLGTAQGSALAKQAPHLVSLCSPLEGGDAWSWIRSHARTKPCLTVLASHTSFESLFNQLSNCTEVTLPDGESMFFAFWDPAILGTIVGQPDDTTLHVKGPVLRQDQLEMLVSGLKGWWYWDRMGEFHAISMDRSRKEIMAGPLKLMQVQVDELVEASVPDHLLYYLELNQPLLFEGIPLGQRYMFIRNALRSARDIGLDGMRDLVNFVCAELIYKERMNEDKIIRSLLEQVKGKQITFDAALKDFP